MRGEVLRCYMTASPTAVAMLACLLLRQLPQSASGANLCAVYILASYRGAYVVLMGLKIAYTAGHA